MNKSHGFSKPLDMVLELSDRPAIWQASRCRAVEASVKFQSDVAKSIPDVSLLSEYRPGIIPLELRQNQWWNNTWCRWMQDVDQLKKISYSQNKKATQHNKDVCISHGKRSVSNHNKDISTIWVWRFLICLTSDWVSKVATLKGSFAATLWTNSALLSVSRYCPWLAALAIQIYKGRVIGGCAS